MPIGEASWSLTNLWFASSFSLSLPYTTTIWGINGQVSSLKDHQIYSRARLGDPQVTKQSTNSVGCINSKVCFQVFVRTQMVWLQHGNQCGYEWKPISCDVVAMFSLNERKIDMEIYEVM